MGLIRKPEKKEFDAALIIAVVALGVAFIGLFQPVIPTPCNTVGLCLRSTTVGLTFENTLPDGLHDAIIGLGYTYQTKSCFMNNRYWLFWVNNGNTTIDHSTSNNGVNWSKDYVDWRSNPNGTVVVNDGRNFALFCDGNFFQTVVGGFTNGTDVACGSVFASFYRRGSPNIDGSITWGNWFLVGCQVGEMQIATDTNDRPMVSAEANLGGINIWRIFADSRNDGTWVNRIGFPFTADSSSGSWWGNIVPLSNNQMYATGFAVTGTKAGNIEGRLWTGSAWQALTVITTGDCVSYASSSCSPSMTVDSKNNIYSIWANSTGISYSTYSGTWSTPTIILSTPTFLWLGGNSVLLMLDSNNNLYVVWTEHFLNSFYFLTKLTSSNTWSMKQTLFSPEVAAPPPAPIAICGCSGLTIMHNNLGPNNSLILGWSANMTSQLSGLANQFFIRATYVQLNGIFD